MTAAAKSATDPRFRKGDRVEVREENIRAWTATVRAVKWSSTSGWWAEIEAEDGSGTWSYRETSPAHELVLLDREEDR